jgi:DNA-binding MarR family transcriptional regulator
MPNNTGVANDVGSTNEVERAMVGRVMAAFEAFQQRLMGLHAVEFTNLEITMAQAKLLYVVTAAGELSMSETAQRLGITVSTASGAVDRLVELGLLERSDDPANRRQVRVSVTDTGRRSLEQLQELNTRQLRALFELISDEDLEVLERATHILTEAASAASATDAPVPQPVPLPSLSSMRSRSS